jgi:hypothetical protein
LAKDVAKVPNNPFITSLTCILGDKTWAKFVEKVTKNTPINQSNLYSTATNWVNNVAKVPNNSLMTSLTCILGDTTWAKITNNSPIISVTCITETQPRPRMFRRFPTILSYPV